MEKKPLVVVNGLVRKDAIAYLKEHVDVRQWTEKAVMPREVLKEWLIDADGLWCVRPLDVDGDLVKNAPNLRVIAQAAVGYDNVNIDELTVAGISFGNTPGGLVVLWQYARCSQRNCSRTCFYINRHSQSPYFRKC